MVLPSTQNHLDVKDIEQGVILLKDGSASMVVQVNSLNFDLLSEPEQDGIIGAYSGFLNSLSFYVQVLIISRRTDVSSYLSKVSQAQERQQNQLLKERLGNYKDFVQQLISKNDVLDKCFYIIVPYKSPLTGGSNNNSPLNMLKKSFGIGGQSKELRFDKADLLKRAFIDLEPKRDHVIEQLRRCGLKAEQLNTEQLITLMYELYNQDSAKNQPLQDEAKNYTTPIVEPKIRL